MSIKQIRSDIESWLTKKCRIDVWDLDSPSVVETIIDGVSYPSNSAFYDPIVDLNVTATSSAPYCTALFRYYVVYRFDKQLAKQQLPIPDIEELHSYLIASSILYPGSLSKSIKKVGVIREEYPIIIRRVEGENSDWTVIMILPFQLEFLAQPGDDFGGLQPPTDNGIPWKATRVGIDIYKRHIEDKTNNDLDRSIVVNGST